MAPASLKAPTPTLFSRRPFASCSPSMSHGLESLATAGVVREVVSVAHLPGMGDGRPLERRCTQNFESFRLARFWLRKSSIHFSAAVFRLRSRRRPGRTAPDSHDIRGSGLPRLCRGDSEHCRRRQINGHQSGSREPQNHAASLPFSCVVRKIYLSRTKPLVWSLALFVYGSYKGDDKYGGDEHQATGGDKA